MLENDNIFGSILFHPVKSDISNQRKSAMTPVYLKEFNSNLINPDYISSTLKQFPQANKDENKLNYNSIERKISGVLNIFKLEC